MGNKYFVQMGRSLNEKEIGTKEKEWNPFAAMFTCKKYNRSICPLTAFSPALGYKILSVEEALKEQSLGILDE